MSFDSCSFNAGAFEWRIGASAVDLVNATGRQAFRAVATWALLIAASQAHAACKYTTSVNFQPVLNDTAKTHLACDLDGMRITFNPGVGYVFTSVEPIGTQVNVQVLRPVDEKTIDFLPDAVGAGAFGLKICATRGKRSGCSTLMYDFDVKSVPGTITAKAAPPVQPEPATSPPPSTAASDKVPIFPEHTSYADARLSLFALGWEPAQSTVPCTAAGMPYAACTYLWKRNQTLIDVVATGGGTPMIDHVKCRVNCSAE